MLQSKAGIVNKDYAAQRSILAEVDAGKISKEELFARGEQLLRDRLQPAVGSSIVSNTVRFAGPKLQVEKLNE
jgi:hypothetical protein